MALITCPECGKEISEMADKCIHCGYPVNVKKEINVQTIEQTGKKYKKQKLYSVLIFIFGIAVMFLTIPLDSRIFIPTGIIISVISIIWFIIIEIKIWWHHK